MKFAISQIADVSTKYITRKDAELISDEKFPGHLASIAGQFGESDDSGVILVIPYNQFIFDETIAEYTNRGLSPQFIKILKELHALEIEQVRFDADGEEIECDDGELKEYSW